MSTKDNKEVKKKSVRKPVPKAESGEEKDDAAALEFSTESPVTGSSDLNLKKKSEGSAEVAEVPADASESNDSSTSETEMPVKAKTEEPVMSPLFRRLAEPVLPELPRENRARLQMQSPSRLHFYWSVKSNPYKTLEKAFRGRTGTYTLVARLINLTNGSEEIFAVEPEGNWWFSVEADCTYRAEIGFYAPNRPYFRIVFSNEVTTPRKSPSRRTDFVPAFNITAHQFANVLDVSGYKRDAFEVAIAGDDIEAADHATVRAYEAAGGSFEGIESFSGEDLRFVLLALASGFKPEDLKDEISPRLFALVSEKFADLTAERALSALEESFEVISEESVEIIEAGGAVVGASLINFPKKVKRKSVPKTLLQKLPGFKTVTAS